MNNRFDKIVKLVDNGIYFRDLFSIDRENFLYLSKKDIMKTLVFLRKKFLKNYQDIESELQDLFEIYVRQTAELTVSAAPSVDFTGSQKQLILCLGALGLCEDSDFLPSVFVLENENRISELELKQIETDKDSDLSLIEELILKSLILISLDRRSYGGVRVPSLKVLKHRLLRRPKREVFRRGYRDKGSLPSDRNILNKKIKRDTFEILERYREYIYSYGIKRISITKNFEFIGIEYFHTNVIDCDLEYQQFLTILNELQRVAEINHIPLNKIVRETEEIWIT